MRPYSDIKIGDVYESNTGLEFVVLEKDDAEKMVLICVNDPLMPIRLNKPFWKRGSANIFNNKVLEGFDI